LNEKIREEKSARCIEFQLLHVEGARIFGGALALFWGGAKTHAIQKKKSKKSKKKSKSKSNMAASLPVQVPDELIPSALAVGAVEATAAMADEFRGEASAPGMLAKAEQVAASHPRMRRSWVTAFLELVLVLVLFSFFFLSY
jgi:hypothetical protein